MGGGGRGKGEGGVYVDFQFFWKLFLRFVMVNATQNGVYLVNVSGFPTDHHCMRTFFELASPIGWKI